MPSKSDRYEFIWKAIQKHGYKYDYREVNYKHCETPVCIICHKKDEDNNEHGKFYQSPHRHLKKAGCHKCGKETAKQHSYSMRLTTEEFIEKARKVHGDKYDYSKVNYINNHTKVCMICPEHGEFWQMPNFHLNSEGCPKCNIGKVGNNIKLTTEEFIEKAKAIHGNEYNYSKVSYDGQYKKVCIICPIHGEFWQMPKKHLKKQGCPTCKMGTNQKELLIFLIDKLPNINIVSEYKNKEILENQSIDIFLPDYNIGIEYQGEQHFIPIDFAGKGKKWAEQQLLSNQIRDELKYNKCIKNNIKLFYYTNEEYVTDTYFDKIYSNKEILLNELLKVIKEKDI